MTDLAKAAHLYTVTWDQLHRDARALAWRLMNTGPYQGIVAVTCTDCLRTFPIPEAINGINTVHCEFCSCEVRIEIIET